MGLAERTGKKMIFFCVGADLNQIGKSAVVRDQPAAEGLIALSCLQNHGLSRAEVRAGQICKQAGDAARIGGLWVTRYGNGISCPENITVILSGNVWTSSTFAREPMTAL